MSVSPTIKLKNKEYANKIRHGSPKLQELLREKCRLKMRERREKFFNRNRFGLEVDSRHMQNTLAEIIRQEFKNLATGDWNQDTDLMFNEIGGPLSQEEAIELENIIVQEQEQWILQEYEKLSQEEIESLVMYADNESKQVFCPICQKVILTEENNCVTCTACQLRLTGRTIEEIRYLVDDSVHIHSFDCTRKPIFMVIPDNDNFDLYMICDDCSTFRLLG